MNAKLWKVESCTVEKLHLYGASTAGVASDSPWVCISARANAAYLYYGNSRPEGTEYGYTFKA